MVESDLSSISSDSVRSALVDTVEEHLKTKDYKINFASAAKQGDNFIGIVQRVTATKTDDNGEISEFKVILKTAPTSTARREQFMSRPSFIREMLLYNEVLPYFEQFQQSKGVTEDFFNQYPKCYRTLDTEPDECLLIEDLSQSDFTMIDRRRESITADHVKLIMKALGKFHAISFAVKDQQPEKLNEIASQLVEVFLTTDKPEMKQYADMLVTTVFDSVATEDHLIEPVKKLFEKNLFEIAAGCVDADLAEPYAVICHGDCWSNNTLFKYDKSGKPIEVSLIDWQITRYCTPVNDILYYLFSCTTKELRDQYYDDFLKTYHDSLSNHLKSLGSDPLKLFPYEVMLEQFRKFGKFGMCMATMLLPMLTSEEGAIPDLDDLAQQLKDGMKMDSNMMISESTKGTLSTRLREVIMDMVRLQYI